MEDTVDVVAHVSTLPGRTVSQCSMMPRAAEHKAPARKGKVLMFFATALLVREEILHALPKKQCKRGPCSRPTVWPCRFGVYRQRSQRTYRTATRDPVPKHSTDRYNRRAQPSRVVPHGAGCRVRRHQGESKPEWIPGD